MPWGTANSYAKSHSPRSTPRSIGSSSFLSEPYMSGIRAPGPCRAYACSTAAASSRTRTEERVELEDSFGGGIWSSLSHDVQVSLELLDGFVGVLHVLGIVGGSHAETPLAAHVAGVPAGRDGEAIDLHVRVVQLRRQDHRLRPRGMAVLRVVAAPHRALRLAH